MSFALTISLPLYSGVTGLSVSITSPGSPTLVNGSGDSLTESGNGIFAATVAEDLVGSYTYVVKRSATPVQSGWFRRVSGQESVLADDERDILSELQNITDLIGEPSGQSLAEDIAGIDAANAFITIPQLIRDTAVAEEGNEIKQYIGTPWRIAINSIGTEPTKVYVTIKHSNETDARATVQAVGSNPVDEETDGLIRIRGQQAQTRENASVEISEYTSDGDTLYRVAFELAAAESAKIRQGLYRMDFKDIGTGLMLKEITINAVMPVTAAIS